MTKSHHHNHHGHHHGHKPGEAPSSEPAAPANNDVMPPAPTPAPVAPPAPTPAPTPASPPTSPSTGVFAGYENWVLSHTSRARNIETALYILPQLVPSSLKDPEVATQSGYSMVGLLGLYHDYILYKSANKDAKGDKLTQLVRVPLSLVSHVQVLAEVTARKFGGEVARWRLIVWIELFKSVCKVLLLFQQRRGLIVGAAKYKSIHPPGTKKSPFARFSKSNQKAGSRTGKVFGANKTVEESPEAAEPTGPLSITFDLPTFEVDNANEKVLLSGELLHILRPLAYALLRQRKDETSWAPAIVSILMEVSGLYLSGSAVKEAKAVPPQKAVDELGARKMALMLYLLRDPVYGAVTKPATEKLCGVTDYVPGFGKLFRLVSIGLMDYYHKYHFYTAAS